MERENVKFVEHEAALTRAERRTRRLTWALIAAVTILGASNVAWLVAALIR